MWERGPAGFLPWYTRKVCNVFNPMTSTKKLKNKTVHTHCLTDALETTENIQPFCTTVNSSSLRGRLYFVDGLYRMHHCHGGCHQTLNCTLHLTAFHCVSYTFVVKHYSVRHTIIGKMTEALLCDKDNETYTQLNFPLAPWFLFTEECTAFSLLQLFILDVMLS